MRMAKTLKRLGLLLGVASLLWIGCLADPFTGSNITADFLSDLDPNPNVRFPNGSPTHYELWVQFNDEGVLSLGKFVVNAELQVFNYPFEDTRIGSVTGAEDLRRSGVNFISDADLSRASNSFVTLEESGETDAAPSSIVIMSGELVEDGPGTLRGAMEGEYSNRLGTRLLPTARITIIIAQDNATF